MMKLIILALTFTMIILSGCSSAYKVKDIDNTIEAKGTVQGQVLGLDSDHRAILQEENSAADELEVQIWRNEKLEDDYAYEFTLLKQCRKDLQDPRLGGSGNLDRLPAAISKTPVKMREEFGLIGDDLQIVKREFYIDRLKVERLYATSLSKVLVEVRYTRESCEVKMGHARIKAGLPFKRYQGKSVINSKGNVESTVKEHEHSLDDAFRITEVIQ